jgi:hypothetical protein
MTPKIPPSATVAMVTARPTVCSSRRRRAAIDLSSLAALHTSESANVSSSSTSVSGRTSGGASAVKASSTSVSGRTSGGASAVKASSNSASGKTSGAASTVKASLTAACGKTCGGGPAVKASSTSAARGAARAAAAGGGAGGWGGTPLWVSGTASSSAAATLGMYGPRPSFDSRALAKSRHRRNLSLGFFLRARAKGASK